MPGGDPYSYNFTFPTINLTRTSVYEISFQLFYLCDNTETECRNIQESISVKINQLEKVYRFDDLANNPTWIEKKILYYSKSGELNVNKNKNLFVLITEIY